MKNQCTKCNEHKNLSEFQIRSDNGKHRNECKVCLHKYKKQRYFATRKHILSTKKKYREDPKNKAHRRKWEKQKRKSDPNHKLRGNLRGRLNSAIKKNSKAGSAVKDLGCSIDELKKYLESKFYSHPKTGKKMEWNNWACNGWHIDHIMPLSSFDLTNRKQFLKACRYTNLQPLWHEENIKKGNKY